MSETISSVEFRNYKAFAQYSIKLQHLNIFVGPNNSGKSTILGAFRILSAALRKARARNPGRVEGPTGSAVGYSIPAESVTVSLENIHTDYADTNTTIRFQLTNGGELTLFFPPSGGCVLIPYSPKGTIRSTTQFKSAFPITIAVVPELGPVEHEELLLNEDTVQRSLNTHRASRHFRNFWWYNKTGFSDFASAVAATWPGMEVEAPRRADILSGKLVMFCLENRITREIYWSGFGFQVWCQLLTHLSRANSDTIVVVDEPETYLHPDLQRQLLSMLREHGPDVIMASHSSEIMSEADPSEILLVEKNRKTAGRLKDVTAVQRALEAVGSIQNITLTRLARNRRVLFVEGQEDFRRIRLFARKLGYSELAAGGDITAVEGEGFTSSEKLLNSAWALKKTLGGALRIGIVLDRDYWSEEHIARIEDELKEEVELVHVHRRKEIENYFLVPTSLQRAVESQLRDMARRTGEVVPPAPDVQRLLREITKKQKSQLQAQYISKRQEFHAKGKKDKASIAAETIDWFDEEWDDVNTRMCIVHGKDTLAALRGRLQEDFGVTLTDARIIDSFSKPDIPPDLTELIEKLDAFRSSLALDA